MSGGGAAFLGRVEMSGRQYLTIRSFIFKAGREGPPERGASAAGKGLGRPARRGDVRTPRRLHARARCGHAAWRTIPPPDEAGRMQGVWMYQRITGRIYQAKWANALFASAMRCTLSRFVTAAPSRL
jgi:hypothetical protein